MVRPAMMFVFATIAVCGIFLLVSNGPNDFHKHIKNVVKMTVAEKVDDRPKRSPAFEAWYQCFISKAGHYNDTGNKAWSAFPGDVNGCQTIPELKYLVDRIKSVHNMDETKRYILPRRQFSVSENATFVTLGVGKDIVAEQAVQKILGNTVEFFGADPITDTNEMLYSKLGQYFPLAVGDRAGHSIASVLENGTYHNKVVAYVDMDYFLSEMVKRTWIDYLWIDAEYAEYGLMPWFAADGRLDQAGIVACQLNLEIHYPSKEQQEKTRDFVKQIMLDGNYAFFDAVNAGHIRVFMINILNPRCQEKYFSP